VEEIRKNFKETVFQIIEHSLPHKLLKKNQDPEYYSREVKGLKVKIRRAYNKRKLGEHFQADLQLLAAKKNQETYLRSVLLNKGICWRGFYKYVKRRTGNRENIPAIQDRNGRHITYAIDKASSLS